MAADLSRRSAASDVTVAVKAGVCAWASRGERENERTIAARRRDFI